MILAMHQIPQMFLIIYGIWLPLKLYIYLESETVSLIPEKSDASTFQEPYVWLIVIICTPFMGREMTLASSAYWVLWWSPAVIIYQKNFGVSDFVDAIRSLITMCIPIALLVPYASKMKIGLLCQEAESRVQLAKNSLILEKETKKSEHVALMVCDKEIYTTLRDKRVQFALFYEELYIISIEIAQLDFIDSMKNLSDRTKTLMGIFDVIQNQAGVHGLQLLHGVGGVFTIVAGLTKSDDPLEKVVSFGCNIHKCVSVLSLAGTNDSVEVRVGIDFGPCVFGVAGKSRFTLDAWGPVCSQSRSMCSSAKANKTRVSEQVMERVKKLRDYTCAEEKSEEGVCHYLAEKDRWIALVADFSYVGEPGKGDRDNIIVLEEYLDD